MHTYQSLVNEALETVAEIFPWDLEDIMGTDEKPLIVDIREPAKFTMAHIEGSLHVPRGQLEGACEWNYLETEPELVTARERSVVLVCCSGRRSALAARTMMLLGYRNVKSLKTGIKGWNDSDLPLIDDQGAIVDADELDEVLSKPLPREKLTPAGVASTPAFPQR
jgi:rhodanese-related sulfurtransferase